jgi:signal transduction histidine kinase
MNVPRLLRTTAARLALRYALLYAALIAAGLGLLYWSTGRFVDAQLRAGLEQAVEDLVRTEHDQGRPELRAHIDADLRFAGKSGLHALLIDADGRALAGDLRGWPPGLPTDGRVHNISFDDDVLPDRGGDEDGYWPALGVQFGDGARLLVARGVDQADALRDFTQGTMATILAVSVALAVALGWLQGRTLLQRVDALSATARAVGAGRLSRRVPLSGRDDEFDDLAGQINSMLDRIEQLLAGMRQVTDNVAHDLRRPLSRMRNRLDVTLLEARSEEEYRDAIERATGDLEEIIRTFNALLEIAQAEAGSFRGDWGPVELEPLLAELGALYRDIAGEQGKRLEIDLAPELQVTGNRQLLGQAVSNLLDNAVKFAPAGTCIRLEGSRDAGRVRLAVTDRGPGIPADQRMRVLERFVRLDSDRSTPGSGLGLSLVAAAARLHGATLTLGDGEPGLVVSLEFPTESIS